MTDEMIIVDLCVYLGVDYYTLLKQPKWFFDVLFARMTNDTLKK